MKITEYLKPFDINIDGSVYYKHLMNHKKFFILAKKRKITNAVFLARKCPLL